MHFFSGFCIASIFSLISAAPSPLNRKRVLTTTVTLVNQCNNVIHVGQLGDTVLNNGNPINIARGSSKTYNFDGQWSGRFWARENCQANNCQIAGAAFPASLAEFTFSGTGGKDYYDVSFVDGYNLPISIEPMQPVETPTPQQSGKYRCGAPSCSTVPSCASELQLLSANGAFIGCKSACSQFGNPEYCCSGNNNTPDACPINSYAAAVKNACPDVYTYAYDDASSLYECIASGYTVTWCP
ncbi:uncharacterized protein ATC70_010871 [Mucor velutinosus]|uniref:Thaumatin-like protein n=1 Tax=Mucor velutinosus TaxID=708070 RepID=A0AAN7DF10_9FUNG|nr:hypothetical protein ATC70_010871 [Mucor velutinosus]